MKLLSKLILVTLCALAGQLQANAETKTARLYDIGTYVTDLDRTVAFYESVFGFNVIKRWDTMHSRIGDGEEQEVPLPGVMLKDAGGSIFEFLQKGEPGNRQQSQEPINHFAIAVDNVQAAIDRALAAGAKMAFPGPAIHYTRIGDFAVENTQVIGLDGERIQILEEYRP